jgi:hypothetical protein
MYICALALVRDHLLSMLDRCWSSANQQPAFLLAAAPIVEVSMKAIRIHQYSDAGTLKLEEIPRLSIADDQIKDVA